MHTGLYYFVGLLFGKSAVFAKGLLSSCIRVRALLARVSFTAAESAMCFTDARPRAPLHRQQQHFSPSAPPLPKAANFVDDCDRNRTGCPCCSRARRFCP